MIEKDTVRLLRECDAGIKMGLKAIDEVMNYAESEELKRSLDQCRDKHERLKKEIRELLDKYQDEGKEPGAVAKSMSWMKTEVKLAVNQSDGTIADLITDGCNMGIKSLSRYLNQFKAADEESKDITKRLIKQEEELAVSMRGYL
ncbi:MAG: hypothetical protein HPZ00_03400 [Christensenellaceae bacterium]|jgi:hypothetical protein|nr:hypothetical protein [Christensenellaceae bacterium]MBS6564018.1 hypothetical protein [Clostridiales bacterium]PWL96463.1 MAG: hypothetical protein DBY09_07395 [Selenomonadales bacterium]